MCLPTLRDEQNGKKPIEKMVADAQLYISSKYSLWHLVLG